MKVSSALLGRGLALLWAAFWMFLFVAESVAWHTPLALTLPWVGVGLLFVFAALAPWRWEMTGGLLLVVIGLSAGVAYGFWSPSSLPLSSRVLTIVAFGAPPVAAGILFVIHHLGVTANA